VSLVMLAAEQVLAAPPKPRNPLPPGVGEGITWAAGAAIFAIGALSDVIAFKKHHGWRMGLASLFYFSGWLTMLDAIGCRQWWIETVSDPNWRFGIRVAGGAVIVFLFLAIAGLLLTRYTPAAGVAHDKMGLSDGDAKKPKLTGSAVLWTFAGAWLALSIKQGTWFDTHAVAGLAWPGDHLGSYLVLQFSNGVGGAAA
jgi:xanthine/uracil/vitamin C permease (AzgA family)